METAAKKEESVEKGQTPMDPEKVLDYYGRFGKYQKFI